MTKLFCVIFAIIACFSLCSCEKKPTVIDEYSVEITVNTQDKTVFCHGLLYRDKIVTVAHIFTGIDVGQAICTVGNKNIPSYVASVIFIDEDNDVAIMDSASFSPSCIVSDMPKGKLSVTVADNDMTECKIMGTVTTSLHSKPQELFCLDAYLPKGASGAPVYSDKGDIIGIIAAREKSGSHTYAIPGNILLQCVAAAENELHSINMN